MDAFCFVIIVLFSMLCGLALFDITYYLPKIYNLLKGLLCQKNHKKHGK